MPQMAPMWWEMMFLYFTIMMMMNITIMYFGGSMSVSWESGMTKDMNSSTWKW